MDSKMLSGIITRRLAVCIMMLALILTGFTLALHEVYAEDEPETGQTPQATRSGEAPDYDYSQEFSNEKMSKAVRILVNVGKVSTVDPYVAIANMIENFDPYKTDLTTQSELTAYDAPVSEEEVESYAYSINLAPYTEITSSDLTDLSKLKKASEVTLPIGVETISAKTFYEMTKLTTVNMPSSVSTIGDSAFEKCESLKTVRTYTVDGSGDFTYGSNEEIVDLSNVKTIKPNAFNACVDIETLILYEDGGLSIGFAAFKACTSLGSVTIPAGTLGTAVFENCTSLTNVVFNDSYKIIPDNSLQNIGTGATVHLPANLEEIGIWALANDSFSSINLPECTKLEKIGDYAFRNTVLDKLPNGDSDDQYTLDLTNTKLKTIGIEAFAGTRRLQRSEVKLPDSVSKIGASAFFYASGISNFRYSKSMTYIPAAAFMCSDLHSLVVPNGSSVNKIGDHAFDMCSNLGSIDFLSSAKMPDLDTIGNYAFARCMPYSGVFTGENGQEWMHNNPDEVTGRYTFETVNIPNSVTKLGKSVFENDFFISNVTLGSGVTTVPERFLICETEKSVTWTDFTVEDYETGKNITYPFKTSNEAAYKTIRNLYSNYSDTISNFSRLESVTMSNDVTKIGNEALRGNTHLKWINDTTNQSSVILPTSLSSIGNYAFANCSYRSGTDKDKDPETGEGGLFTAGISKVKMPASLGASEEEDPIGEYAFSGCFTLGSVEFPSSLKAIPAHCFEGCGFDDYYREGDESVHHYHGLSKISDISNLVSIGDYAFNKCYNLSNKLDGTGLEFGRKLSYLGQYSFANTGIKRASSLSSTAVTEIKQGTFDGCRDLQMVYCPDSVESINNYAFRNCPSLTMVNFPVYATLSASMVANDSEHIQLTPTLGRYRNAKYKVPILKKVNLPAAAFARSTTVTISQVDPDNPENSTEITQELIDAGENYFIVTPKDDSFEIEGSDKEVLGTAVRISANVMFNDVGDRAMSIDYPVDVTNIHADPDTIRFDASKFKIGNANYQGVIVNSDDPMVYVSKSRIGQTLTLAAEAKSLRDTGEVDVNRGMITDEAEWLVTSGASVTPVPDSSVKTTSTDICNVSSGFTIADTGISTVDLVFGREGDKPAQKTIKVSVVDAVSKVNYCIDQLGEDNANPTSLTMPRDTSSVYKLKLDSSHLDSDKPYDAVILSSSNESVVKIEASNEDGVYKIVPNEAGSSTINLKTVCGNATASIAVTVKGEGEVVNPTFMGIKPVDGGDMPTDLFVGDSDSLTFEAVYWPAADSTKGVTWSVSNNAATIDNTSGETVTLTGMTPGNSVTLTVKAKNGGKTASAKFAVRQKVDNLSIVEANPIVAKDKTKFLILKGSNTQNGVIVRDPGVSDEYIEFETSNPSVLAIGTSSTSCSGENVRLNKNDSRLYYKGIKDGTATITATSESGKTAHLDVRVTSNSIKNIDYYIGSLTSDHKNTTRIYMPKDQTDSIKATAEYTDDSEKYDKLVYSSSDSSIVSVDEEGNLKANTPGEANITIASATGLKSQSVTVVVRNDHASTEPLFVKLKRGDGGSGDLDKTIYVDESAEYKADCLPAYAAQDIDWSVNDTSLAEVTPDADGKATVTAKIPNKNVTLTAQAVVGATKTTLSIALKQRANVEFKEESRIVAVGKNGNIVLRNTDSVDSITDGIARMPSTSTEPVTFTITSGSEFLNIGESASSFGSDPVTLSANNSKLYYEGVSQGTATITASTAKGSDTIEVKVVDHITKIEWPQSGITLLEGQTSDMRPVITPSNSQERVEYLSDNPGVASVDQNGAITAVSQGTANITARSTLDSNVKSVCKVTVQKEAESLVFREKPPVIAKNVNKYFTLSSVDDPNEASSGIVRTGAASDQTVEFTLDDSSKEILQIGKSSSSLGSDPVAITTKNGNLYYKGLKQGTAKITAKTVGSSSADTKTAELTVTVIDKPITGLKCTNPNIYLARGKNATMELEATPADNTDIITYSSNEESIASVNANGQITAGNLGKAVITARSGVNGKTATCTVNVVEEATSLEFRQPSATVKINTLDSTANKIILQSVDDSSTVNSGIVRTPASSWEDVTFTSSDPTMLLLGTRNSSSAVKETSVTLSGEKGTLYFKGIKQGTAYIIATIGDPDNGGLETRLPVTIVTPITSISAVDNTINLGVGGQANARTTKTPADSNDTLTYSYTSSNTKVATVTSSGLITTKGKGSATITVTATGLISGKKTAKITVKVTETVNDTYGVLDPNLPKVKIKKPKKAKKSLTAKWKKLSKKQMKKVKGIEVEYSLTPDFQGPKFKKAGKKKTSVKVKNLVSGKTYYVRAHTYVYRGGIKYVSNWSVPKKTKVK